MSSPADNTRSHFRTSSPSKPSNFPISKGTSSKSTKPIQPSSYPIPELPPTLKIKNSNFRVLKPLKSSPDASRTKRRMIANRAANATGNIPTSTSSPPKKEKSPSHLESQRNVSPTRSTASAGTTFSYFSAKSKRDSTSGILAGAIATGLDYHAAHSITSSPSRISTKTVEFLDKVVQADQKRYRDIDPESDELVPVSYVFAGLLTVIFVVMIIAGDGQGNSGFTNPHENPMLGPNIETFVRFGGNISIRVQESFAANGWTIFSASYIHIGILHLFFNAGSIMVIGPKVDRWFGPTKVVLIYIITGIASYIANSLIRSTPVVAVGASGGICGVLGAILAEGIKNWDHLNYPVFQLVTWGSHIGLFLALVSLLTNYSQGYIPKLNNVAHVGGFLAGICAGLVLLPRMPKKGDGKYGNLWSTVLFIIGLIGLVLIVPVGLILLSNGVNFATSEACNAFLSVSC
jgi:membrane associated rhomboid family serine protease